MLGGGRQVGVGLARVGVWCAMVWELAHGVAGAQ